MKNRIFTVFFLILWVACLGSVQAAVLITYDFTGGINGTLGPISALAPSTTPPANITATSISVASGIPGTTFQDNGGNIELNLLPGASSAGTAAAAVSGNQYIEFTLNTPSASFALDLDNLQLDLRRGGATGNRHLFLRTSLDAFANDIGPGVVLAPASTTLTTFTFNDIPLFNNVTDAVTFRLYTYNDGATNRSVRVDNIVVNGAVIPEPSTVLLLLGGLGALVLLRARKAQGRSQTCARGE
ncbi:MAG: PEP-CTERM sorting domain-containing protein [Blastochloris sp.]|nr:PEP-CTERM sorting domain-containing protein [Blastochloris sp.]